jgi:hypothetical protein
VSLLYCVSSVFLFLHLFYFIAPRSCFSNTNNVDIEISPAIKEEDSYTIEECYVSIYPMEEVEEELSNVKQKVD